MESIPLMDYGIVANSDIDEKLLSWSQILSAEGD